MHEMKFKIHKQFLDLKYDFIGTEICTYDFIIKHQSCPKSKKVHILNKKYAFIQAVLILPYTLLHVVLIYCDHNDNKNEAMVVLAHSATVEMLAYLSV